MNWLENRNLVNAPWIVFVAYWVISARNLKPAKVKEPAATRLVQLVLVTIAAVLLFSSRLRVGWLDQRFVAASAAVGLLGLIMTYAGIAIAIWARYHIGEYWSARVTLKTGHRLIRSGPYAYVRHPIYSGLLLAMLGTALVVGKWRGLVAMALLLAVHWGKAQREERLLTQEFGEEYQQYRRQTWFLIPGAY